jgi:hypothetical protein
MAAGFVIYDLLICLGVENGCPVEGAYVLWHEQFKALCEFLGQ